MSRIKKNLGLQTAYQIVAMCTPLITAPHLARKLGAAQLGVFSYSASVVAYFGLIAMLGTVNYGTRSIAPVKNDRAKRSEIFGSIYLFQLVTTALALVGYGIYILFFCKDNTNIALLQGISVISCLFDVTWLFFGMEDFQITVTRSIVIKLCTVALILLLVRKEADLWIYALIMLGGTLIGQLVLFACLPRYVSFTRVRWQQMRRHIHPNLVLFVPLLAMSVYHTMDKTMLGLMSNYEQSGFYYNADRIVQIPLLIITGVGTVMLPRMSALISEKKDKEANTLFMMTMEGVTALSVAMACGLAAVSREFVPVFFGNGYEPCIYLIVIFAPLVLIKGSTSIIRTQYLIPMNMETEFTKSVIGGAVVNLILNLILIPPYQAAGAAIATVIAELVAYLFQLFSLRGRGLGMRKIFINTSLYALIGLVMIAVVRVLSFLAFPPVMQVALEVVAGVGVYGAMCVLFWEKTGNPLCTVFRKWYQA